MIAELRVTPVDSQREFRQALEDVLRIVHDSHLHYVVGPMSTSLEGPLEEILGVVRRCHERFRTQGERVLIELSIDDHPSREGELVRGMERLREISAGLPLERLVSAAVS